MRILLGLVEVRVSTEHWPRHPRLSKKKKNLSLPLFSLTISLIFITINFLSHLYLFFLSLASPLSLFFHFYLFLLLLKGFHALMSILMYRVPISSTSKVSCYRARDLGSNPAYTKNQLVSWPDGKSNHHEWTP